MSALDDLYNKTVNDQRDYLVKLQEAFNQHCDQITAEAQKKLTVIPETDLQTRKNVFDEQKKLLDEALIQLKKEIDSSHTQVRKKLEEIHGQRELETISELEQIMTKF